MVFAFYILLFVILELPSLAVYSNLQRQLVRKSDQGELIQPSFTKKIGEATVLNLPDHCSAYPLLECHLNDVDEENFYTFCFSDFCPKEKYFCINGNGYTLHICAEIPKCENRFRNVVLYDSDHPNSLQIFSVPCPDSYHQFSYDNCFDTCLKDHSIVVVRNTTPNHQALAYCNNEADKCNPHGKLLFYLASKDDVCITADKPCGDNEELQPDCSCSPRCLPGQERTAVSNFICEPDTKPTTIQPQSIRPTTLVTSQSTPSLSESKNPNDKQENDPSTFVGEIVGAVFGIILLAGVIVAIVWFCCKHRGYEKTDTETGEETEPKEVHDHPPTSNGVNSGHQKAGFEENGNAGHRKTEVNGDAGRELSKTIKKSKCVTNGDTVKYQANGNIIIHNYNQEGGQRLLSKSNSDRSINDTDLINGASGYGSGHSVLGDSDVQVMDEFKEVSFTDSWIAADDQTLRKQIA